MLCRQVLRALSLTLGELSVVDVTPAPDCTRLLVHVAIPRHIAVEQALADLSIAAPSLRTQVARAITRKRAPELAFVPARMTEVSDES